MDYLIHISEKSTTGKHYSCIYIPPLPQSLKRNVDNIFTEWKKKIFKDNSLH